ncbi:hypothetical protein FA13DRAFT_1794806 [Coprinellus micaceus]|uniref:Uncharacterized protein n=1 Tax=Coprinellus micaceus TaxID=71717 RepID=A0A4Y7SZV8_COPMI|nr:hypothetical protein FA13DRAFT_1794806 [Coprinellus micaceus]
MQRNDRISQSRAPQSYSHITANSIVGMILNKSLLFFVSLAAPSLASQFSHVDDLLYERQLELDTSGELEARKIDIDAPEYELELDARALRDMPERGQLDRVIHMSSRTSTTPIAWPNTKCNKLPAGHLLLELPVFPNGEHYDYKKKSKEDSGMARHTFSWPSKDLRGVIAHEGDSANFCKTKNLNLGALKLCGNA